MSDALPPAQESILIADDSQANLRVLSDMLALHGYKVRPAINGKLALMAVRAAPPDLILLDINMPELDGFEVCQQLKADKGTQDIPVIFISAMDEVADKVKAFNVGGVDYITKPFQIEEVLARVENQLLRRRLQKQLEEANALLEKRVEERTIELVERNIDLQEAYEATIEGWARFLDLRDEETEGHTRRVTEMTERLAAAMGIREPHLEHMRRGAILHDIGKMAIPDTILLKPGSLNDEEWTIMRLHPVYAYQMLSPIKYLKEALDIPHYHHEKWNGAGYPEGLKEEAIPLAARIFAVVDVWDALRSNRRYRQGWPEERVLAYIRSLAGEHFDPAVVEVFLKLFEA